MKNSVGDWIDFGGILWRIMDLQEEKMLILTEDILFQKDYHDKPEETTWKECSLRTYLHKEFLDRFSIDEKSRILEVTNKNLGNPWYGGMKEEDTVDRVFLLSLDESVRLYFGDSSKLLDFRSPKQRYWFQRKDLNNVKRRAVFDSCSWWWWIRTSGKNGKYAGYIHGDGNIGIQGNGVSKRNTNVIHPHTGSAAGGVRPAMWIQINKKERDYDKI